MSHPADISRPRDDRPRRHIAPRGPSVFSVLNVLLRHRLLVAACTIALPLAAAALVMMQPRTYTSTAVVVPQSRRLPSNLGGLAAQFGVALPTADATQSPSFYADLARSRSILLAISDSTYTYDTPDGRVSGPLHSIVPDDAAKKSLPLRRDETVEWLREHLVPSAAQRTGVVSISAETESPVLSQQILVRILAELDRYNQETRQSQARSERRFTEQRLSDARRDLRQAEERLVAFGQQNRAAVSPQLRAELQRLEREVGFREQVVTSLVQAFEQARIDEVRDTPVFSLIDPPSAPARPNGRGLVLRLLAAIIAGAGLGVLLAFMRDGLRPRTVPAGAAEDDFDEFVMLRREAAHDLRHPLRGLRRAFGGRSTDRGGDRSRASAITS